MDGMIPIHAPICNAEHLLLLPATPGVRRRKIISSLFLSSILFDMREKFQQVAGAMKTHGVDALVLTPGADLFYLTGFEHGHAGERLLALVLKQDGSAQWIAPAMNVPQVEDRAQAGETVRGWTDAEWYGGVLRDAISGAETVAFDDEARSAFLLELMATAPNARLLRASEIMRGLRIRKTADELAMLRAAAAQVDRTIPQAVALCQPGRIEAEIDQELRAALLARNSQSAVAFTIVASGPNSALPHHETGRRTLGRGDVVILDFGTRGVVPVRGKSGAEFSHSYGYNSDITVTCAVSEPIDPEVRKVYGIVRDAQQAAIDTVRPGVACQDVDRAARAVIETAGYGEFFIHRTGHGLGLQVHEPPFIRTGEREILEEGMVFSIEPGIYLAERFGVRLEIIASVSATGISLINAPSASELPIAR
jgi:D-alanyl-D-alanine dipeptidase